MPSKTRIIDKHPFPDKVLKQGGAAWKVLFMARSLRTRFTWEDLMAINPQFTRRYSEKPLTRLTNIGLLHKHGGGYYEITNQGVHYINMVSVYWSVLEASDKK
jgi:hypothetical protein